MSSVNQTDGKIFQLTHRAPQVKLKQITADHTVPSVICQLIGLYCGGLGYSKVMCSPVRRS